MKIIIDNGHGIDTPGKCSPDGKYKEYKWAREIASAIVEALEKRGYPAQLLVPGENDMPLAERVNKVNGMCARLGADNVLLVSIHSNASGNGQWMKARGWSAYTTKGQTKSDELATCLYNEAGANLAGQQIRKDMSDGDPDWEADFYILKKTRCAAVLTENFFHDNQYDLAYMTSSEGRHAIVNTHVNGIINYINKRK